MKEYLVISILCFALGGCAYITEAERQAAPSEMVEPVDDCKVVWTKADGERVELMTATCVVRMLEKAKREAMLQCLRGHPDCDMLISGIAEQKGARRSFVQAFKGSRK